MVDRVLAFNPGGITHFPIGVHHPAAALFCDGQIEFAVEEERFTRDKYAYHTFPENAIKAALEYAGIQLADIDRIVVPWRSELERKKLSYDLWLHGLYADGTVTKLFELGGLLKDRIVSETGLTKKFITDRMTEIGTPVPPLQRVSHHRAHAASAFHFSPFDDAVVITADGKGEYDSTVVWRGSNGELERERTYKFPNSLGRFFRAFAEFLGYSRKSRSEGKVMALAPYGSENHTIKKALRSEVDISPEYDVSYFADRGAAGLENVLGRMAKQSPTDFTEWEKDLAFTGQRLLEQIVTGIVDKYLRPSSTKNLCLAGGVMLNCKLNQKIRELDIVEDIFVQPAAHDGGTVLGAGVLASETPNPKPMESAFLGPKTSSETIREHLAKWGIPFSSPNNLEHEVAAEIADGALIGWVQGRLEFGPRALGRRSILADPRKEHSRDRINSQVKNREEWRPFSPSILADAAETYLERNKSAPFMIETFNTNPSTSAELEGVLHPEDGTIRPQTVTKAQSPRFYSLIREFERITGVPAILNTSFNDNGEPIVNTPSEAVRDFFTMGLDLLVLGDCVIRKPSTRKDPNCI